MAAGDFTITEASLDSSGKFLKVNGTLEADTTKRAFDIFPNGYVHSFHVETNDAVNITHQVELNVDASATVDNGSVAVDASGAATMNWTAHYVS